MSDGIEIWASLLPLLQHHWKSMLNIRKIQYRMRLGEAGEEVSAVQAVLRKVCPTYAKYKVGCVL